MAGRGRRVTFHGAFTSKADARRKERKVRGFIRETRIKGKRRFMVLTAKGKGNPYRVTAFAEEKKRGKVRGYGYDVLGPFDSPTRIRGTGSFYYPHLQAAKHAAAKEFLDPRVHQVAIKTHQDKEVGRLYRKRKKKNPVSHTRRHPGPSRPRWWPERADYPPPPIRRGNRRVARSEQRRLARSIKRDRRILSSSVRKKIETIPDMWLAGRMWAHERAGQSPGDALKASIQDWHEQRRLESEHRKGNQGLGQCAYCGGPDGVFPGPGHSFTCSRYRKPLRRVKTISARRKKNATMKDRQQCPECKAWHWKRPSGVCAKCEQRRGNPSGVVAEIPGRIEAIDYLRPKNASPAPDRKGVRGNFVPYRHAFRSSAKMLALADGSVLITPSKGGRRLWTPAGPKGWAR